MSTLESSQSVNQTLSQHVSDVVPTTQTNSQPNQGLFFEYSTAADPVCDELTPHVPIKTFEPIIWSQDNTTRIIPLDLSTELKCPSPATSPGLVANFVVIEPNHHVDFQVNATSLIAYVHRGSGSLTSGEVQFNWKEGDFFSFPGIDLATLRATSQSLLYVVHDQPLLNYLGATVSVARFRPTLYPKAQADAELQKAMDDPASANRSRISVLLGADEFPLTRTVTHVLWAMYGTIGPDTNQKPHRHQSVALDFIVDCQPGCFSLLGKEVDENGDIIDPIRVDWQPGIAFVTPPGMWHSHHNVSDSYARLIPVQDAGLQTYLRSLDIRFL